MADLWLTGHSKDSVTSSYYRDLDLDDIPVAPSSLYLAQLYERLGKQALVNIGYKVNGL